MPKGTVNTELVKQAYSKNQYDSDMLLEFNNVRPQMKGPNVPYEEVCEHTTPQEVVFLEPTITQEDLIQNYNENRYSINMLGRQMGKTTVAAGYLLWFAMFKPTAPY